MKTVLVSAGLLLPRGGEGTVLSYLIAFIVYNERAQETYQKMRLNNESNPEHTPMPSYLG